MVADAVVADELVEKVAVAADVVLLVADGLLVVAIALGARVEEEARETTTPSLPAHDAPNQFIN